MMNEKKEREDKVAITAKTGLLTYGIVLFFGLLSFLIGGYTPWIPDERLRQLLLGIAPNLIVLAIIFIFVERFVGWRPIHEQVKLLEAVNDESQSTIDKLKQILDDITLQNTGVEVYTTEEDMYAMLITTLNKGKWEHIRIFAPVGIWGDNESKKKWLSAVGTYLTTHPNTTLQGIFGLPPVFRGAKERDRSEVQHDLNRAKETLAGVTALSNKNIELHYVMSDSEILGIGVVIFQDADAQGILTFGIARWASAEIVNTGFRTNNKKLFRAVTDWFDQKLFRAATENQVLLDSRTPLTEGWVVVDGLYKSHYQKSFEPLEGKKRIYESIRDFSTGMDSQLRALIFGGIKSPDDWTEAVADALKRTQDAGKPASFWTIIAVDHDIDAKAFSEAVDKRIEIYQAKGVADNVKLFVLEVSPCIGTDMLIVDRKHVFVGVPSLLGEPSQREIHKAFLFANQPTVAEDYLDIFNAMIVEKGLAVPYADWLREMRLSGLIHTEQ